MPDVAATDIADRGVTMGQHLNRLQLEKMMKTTLYCLLLFCACNFAWADVRIKYVDMTGATSTMISNGYKVRINGGNMPGYLLLDSAGDEFYVVDTSRNEAIRIAADETGSVAEVGSLNVGLMARGGREKVAGYTTGRFDLLANGEYCGTIYGSSKLIQIPEMKRMFTAMQGMHKISRSMAARASSHLTECQRANTRLADLADTSGFVLRALDDKGNRTFEVLSIETGALVEQSEYDLPKGMAVVDMNEKLEAGAQQMPDMEALMEQIQQNGGQVTPEMQEQMQQMQQMMEQMQQTQ